VINTFCNFSPWHTQTADVAMMHTGGGEIVQREGSGARSAGHGTGRVLHDEREKLPPNHPITHLHPQYVLITFTDFKSAETVIYRNSRTCTQELVPYSVWEPRTK